MEKRESTNLSEGVIWKRLLWFFLPIVIGTWFQQLYNAVDAVIVGKYVGTEALASVSGTPATLINVIISIFVSLASGSSVIVSQYYGAGRKKELEKATGTAVTFCIILGLILMLCIIPLTVPILRWMSTPEEIIDSSALYMRIFCSGLVITLLLNIESGILRGVGDSKNPLIYMITACVLNIVLDIVFVRYMNMGVAGAAIATVLAQLCNMILLTWKLMTTKESYRLNLRCLGINSGVLSHMMKLGIPQALQGGVYSISNAYMQAAINKLGTVVVASWGLAGKVDGFYWATASAAGIAVTAFVGQNYGAGDFKRVWKTARTGMGIFIPMTLLICAALLLFGPNLLPMFTDNAEVVSTTYTIMLYFVPFYFTWTILEVLTAVMRGCGEVRKPAIISIFGIGIFRFVWVWTVYALYPTLFNISIVYAISWTITATIILIYYIRWKKKLVEKNVK
ncbi:MAG: MATE family efflux transporter [Eubacteriales bacterium]|nr:MATE family efflux transporter [Eubacteriales bacterium]